jgi:hypothetical protein
MTWKDKKDNLVIASQTDVDHMHYAKKAVALYKVFEFEIRNVLIMRIGHRSKKQEYAR